MTFVRDSQGPAALSVYSFEAAAADQSTAAERSCSSSVRLPVSFIYFTCSEVQFLRCANKKIVFYKVTSFCFCQNLQRAFLQLNSGYNCHLKCDVFRFPRLIYVNITFRNSTDKIDIRDMLKTVTKSVLHPSQVSQYEGKITHAMSSPLIGYIIVRMAKLHEFSILTEMSTGVLHFESVFW